MRTIIESELKLIQPCTEPERRQWLDALSWVRSGAPLFRTAKPATPPKHLVAYFPVVDGDHILLVDHKNARKWLPPGGHVDPDEHPRATVVRELFEELGLTIDPSEVPAPLLVSVTETVGLTAGHVDVSLWYPVQGCRTHPLAADLAEFNEVRWFHRTEAAALQSDPDLPLFLAKLHAKGCSAKSHCALAAE